MLNSHLIGFLALAKERVRLLPFGWHPGTQLLGAHLNSYVYPLLSALGLPPLLPRARAARRPAWVRLRIRLRSNSASAPKM
ncbi:MAG: hypothetical protein KZQ63_12195 [Candidatus Thiodiazotropha sp. (ex Lucinoma aequizonata)]|nr:hypothetical protein [Candidatus Thiodiazotropha sp. (ex Lucinoma aequizonata)]MCU7899458.1 hypothetical protein [Candidatus Thiodiazotropha sp. (ex Lucinoma aequizonata)]MCU7912706.1 hypothetical protein [Candidatus Thiodiazotropha sp. (ex Lucinoma aequizonata)]